MAIFTAVSEPALSAFLSAYGVVLTNYGGIAAGSVNSNYWVEGKSAYEGRASASRLFLRVYEEQDAEGAAAEAGLLRALAQSGVPTPAPLANEAGESVGMLSGKPAALFPWRAGGMRCQASVASGDVRQLGGALARIHRFSAHQSAPGRGISHPGRFRRADLELRLDAIGQAADPELRALAPELRALLAEVDDARARPDRVPRGIVHGDLFRDNVLFGDDGTLVALLDFESAFEGAFVFDLAVCLLSWTYGDDFDLTLGRALVRGYAAERTLEPGERGAFFEEARFAALRFTITRMTDFAMRSGLGAGVKKDWRRFFARFDRLTALGAASLAEALFGEDESP